MTQQQSSDQLFEMPIVGDDALQAWNNIFNCVTKNKGYMIIKIHNEEGKIVEEHSFHKGNNKENFIKELIKKYRGK